MIVYKPDSSTDPFEAIKIAVPVLVTSNTCYLTLTHAARACLTKLGMANLTSVKLEV
jgi:hypothetical protein